jgi:hypothetical protein
MKKAFLLLVFFSTALVYQSLKAQEEEVLGVFLAALV